MLRKTLFDWLGISDWFAVTFGVAMYRFTFGMALFHTGLVFENAVRGSSKLSTAPNTENVSRTGSWPYKSLVAFTASFLALVLPTRFFTGHFFDMVLRTGWILFYITEAFQLVQYSAVFKDWLERKYGRRLDSRVELLGLPIVLYVPLIGMAALVGMSLSKRNPTTALLEQIPVYIAGFCMIVTVLYVLMKRANEEQVTRFGLFPWLALEVIPLHELFACLFDGPNCYNIWKDTPSSILSLIIRFLLPFAMIIFHVNFAPSNAPKSDLKAEADVNIQSSEEDKREVEENKRKTSATTTQSKGLSYANLHFFLALSMLYIAKVMPTSSLPLG
jgi:hypothetical protein